MNHLLQMFENSPIAIYSCDRLGHITFFNRAAVLLWGREPEIGIDLWCGSWKRYQTDGKSIPDGECPIALALKEGNTFESSEILIERPDHSFRNLLIFPRPLYDEQNKIIGAHNTLVDITDRYDEETKQAILSAIVESSDDAIISKDLQGTIKSWNSGAQKIFGYTEQEIIGKPITILIPPSRLNEEKIILQNIKNGYSVDHFQTIRLDKYGNEIPISLTVSPIKNGKGKVIGASKVARNISDQLKGQEALRKSLENLELLNSIGKGISEKMDVEMILQRVIDTTTKITRAAFGAFFYNTIDKKGEPLIHFALSGIPKSIFENFETPNHANTFYPPFTGIGAVRVDDVTKNSHYVDNVSYFSIPEGHPPVISYLAVPVVSTTGAIIGGLFFGHPKPGVFKLEQEDVVVSIASQAAVALDNSKLFEEIKALNDKKDEFIALASHELKTPLTTIKGFLQVLAKSKIDKIGRLFLQKSLNQVDKLNALVDDLLNVSKIEAGKLEFFIVRFDLKQLLVDIAETFQYSNNTHEIICEISDQDFFINADKQRIEQAVTNLLTNAIKYSPEAKKVLMTLQLGDGKVIIKIKDEGIGLTSEQKSKIFSRFYRAEGVKHIAGLGLGLYLTKEIITRHKGSINVISEIGKGSEFHFTLPY